jgi:hypothetical protein
MTPRPAYIDDEFFAVAVEHADFTEVIAYDPLGEPIAGGDYRRHQETGVLAMTWLQPSRGTVITDRTVALDDPTHDELLEVLVDFCREHYQPMTQTWVVQFAEEVEAASPTEAALLANQRLGDRKARQVFVSPLVALVAPTGVPVEITADGTEAVVLDIEEDEDD